MLRPVSMLFISINSFYVMQHELLTFLLTDVLWVRVKEEVMDAVAAEGMVGDEPQESKN